MTDEMRALKEPLICREEIAFNRWVLYNVINLQEWEPKMKGHQLPDIMADMTEEYIDDELVKVALEGELFKFMGADDFANYLRDHGYTVKEDVITIYTLVG